jgi:hypothetical protein
VNDDHVTKSDAIEVASQERVSSPYMDSKQIIEKFGLDAFIREMPDKQREYYQEALDIPNVNEYRVEKPPKVLTEMLLAYSRLPQYKRSLLDGEDSEAMRDLAKLIESHGSSMITLIPKNEEDDRIVVMGDDYKGCESIQDFQQLFAEKLGLDRFSVPSLSNYYIIEREYPSTSNVHSVSIIADETYVTVELGDKLYEIISGKPTYQLQFPSYYYSYLLSGRVSVKDLIEKGLCTRAGEKVELEDVPEVKRTFLNEVFVRLGESTIDMRMIESMEIEATCDNEDNPTDIHFESIVPLKGRDIPDLYGHKVSTYLEMLRDPWAVRAKKLDALIKLREMGAYKEIGERKST